MTTADILARFPGAKRSGAGWQARCPAHDDKVASLAIKEGSEGKTLLKCHAGCSLEAVVAAAGLTLPNLFLDDTPRMNGNGKGQQDERAYGYESETGALLYQNVRRPGKRFYQRRPDGKGGWINNLDGIERVPYRLPELLDAIKGGRIVFVCEGEKDVESLRSLKVQATTTGGALSWKPHFAKRFVGAPKVVILPDNDDSGEQYARAVARDLIPVAKRVAIVRLPGLPPHGDVSDWLGMGGDKAQLVELVRSTPPLTRDTLDALSAIPATTPALPGPAGSPDPAEADETATPIRHRPRPLGQAAYHGLAGDFLRVVSPQTEADPAALLAQLLACFGNAIHRTAHFLVEQDRHYTNEFVLLVGETGSARKGMALNWCRKVMRVADETWSRDCLQQGGLSSGEGLIHNVRDPMEIPGKRGKGKDGNPAPPEMDPGVTDKRLLLAESEFASVLKMFERNGNTLSVVIRQAWDSGDLRTMTKGSPERATGAHISLIGHITPLELRSLLKQVDAANGVVNRFLIFSVSRSKHLPSGGHVPPDLIQQIGERVGQALTRARGIGAMGRDAEAEALWVATYPSLTDQPPGLWGSMVTPRAAPHVLRVAMLYALMDGSALIQCPHLLAALEVWRYSVDSVRFIFGDSLGYPVADKILAALEAAEPVEMGLTMTEMHQALGGHASGNDLRDALQALYGLGRAVPVETTSSGGRTPERWAIRPKVCERSEESPPPTPREGLLSLNSHTSQPETPIPADPDGVARSDSEPPPDPDDPKLVAFLRDLIVGRDDLSEAKLLAAVPYHRQPEAAPILARLLADRQPNGGV